MTRRPLLHPVIQVRGYCDYLADFLGVLEGHEGAIKGAAYLHNATEHGISDLRALRQDERGRMFTGERRGEFIDYLRHHFAPESGAPAAEYTRLVLLPRKRSGNTGLDWGMPDWTYGGNASDVVL